MTTYRVSAPVAAFTGEVGKCHFVKGVYEGEVEDGPLAYFRQAGYTVEDLDAETADETEAAAGENEPAPTASTKQNGATK